jgi:hypothetical protein
VDVLDPACPFENLHNPRSPEKPPGDSAVDMAA